MVAAKWVGVGEGTPRILGAVAEVGIAEEQQPYDPLRQRPDAGRVGAGAGKVVVR